MKLFRKERKSDKQSQPPFLQSPSSPSPQSHSPQPMRRGDEKDRDRDNRSRNLSTSLQVSFDTNSTTSGAGSLNNSSNSVSSSSSDKKHTIRIGDTRFFGRILFRARALYDYPIDGDTLQIEDEEIKLLRFRKNDIINVYEQDPSGWWAGEYNGLKGIFPGSYMKVIEEEPEDTKQKNKDLSKDDLMRKITELERKRDSMHVEKEKIRYDFEKEKSELERRINENKHKSEGEVLMLKKVLKDKQDLIEQQASKIRQLEYEKEECVTKLSAKEVDVITMEMELKDYKKKLPDYLKAEQDAKIRRLQEEKEVKASLLKDIDTELVAKRNELHDVVKLRQEIEKGLHEAQTKLVDLETSSRGEGNMEKRIKDLEKQVDLMKKQLGEEVYDKRKAENELREVKSATSSEIEALKKEKMRLESEAKGRAEADAKLSKINLILQGILQKDDTSLSVPIMKDILSKMRRAMINLPPEDNSRKEAEKLTPRGRTTTIK